MLSERPTPPINTFSQKPAQIFEEELAAALVELESQNEIAATTTAAVEDIIDAPKKTSSNPFLPLESLMSKLPNDMLGSTNILNEMLNNMTSLLQEGHLKSVLKNVDQVLNKNKSVHNEPNWSFFEEEEEVLLIIELPFTPQIECISLCLDGQLISLQLTEEEHELIGEKKNNYSITLPFVSHPSEITAYYDKDLIEVHIPKKHVTQIPLIPKE